MSQVIAKDGNTYNLSPLRAGQLRDMAKVAKEHPERMQIEENFTVVLYALNNAVAPGEKQYTSEDVENLTVPVYEELFKAAVEISGMVTANKSVIPGESKAT